jgi:hypothetical protein
MNSAVKSLFTKYLSHLTGYIVAAATTVSAVDPGLLPPLGKLAVGIAGLIVFASNHAYQAGTGVAAAQAAVDATTKALGAVANGVKGTAPMLLAVCLLCASAAGGLTGCAQVQSFLGSPTGVEVVTAAVDIAVATAEAKGISAVQINTIAKKAVAANSSATATLAAVSAVVQSEVQALHLPAADQAAADILISALSAAIQAKVGSNTTLATVQADAAVVLQAVVVATGG